MVTQNHIARTPTNPGVYYILNRFKFQNLFEFYQIFFPTVYLKYIHARWPTILKMSYKNLRISLEFTWMYVSHFYDELLEWKKKSLNIWILNPRHQLLKLSLKPLRKMLRMYRLLWNPRLTVEFVYDFQRFTVNDILHQNSNPIFITSPGISIFLVISPYFIIHFKHDLTFKKMNTTTVFPQFSSPWFPN